MMSWTDWYIQAILHMAEADAMPLLTRLLSEPEYEEAAAAGLFHMARTDKPRAMVWPRGWSMRTKDFGFVWRARAGASEVAFTEPIRSEAAALIRNRIEAILVEQASSEYPEDFDHRLRSLANILAELDGLASAKLVLQILDMPTSGKYLYSAWSRIHGLEALLMRGIVLP